MGGYLSEMTMERNSDLDKYEINKTEQYWISAPTFSQCFRWFREKYQLDSSIALVANGYGFYIHKNRNYTNKGESYGMYITYEEAELACLKKLIEIVKDGTKINTRED